MLIENPKKDVLVGTVRDPASAGLKAVRTGIGAALQALYFEILQEELVGRIAELAQQLDQERKHLDQQKNTNNQGDPPALPGRQ